ncbi:MAG: hypothetical protein R3F59_10630 [Myxococcota bacterium]
MTRVDWALVAGLALVIAVATARIAWAAWRWQLDGTDAALAAVVAGCGRLALAEVHGGRAAP